MDWHNLIHVDALSGILTGLVLFITLIVNRFSRRYLDGDSAVWRFHFFSSLMALSIIVMVSANHLMLLLLSWGLANICLIQLMSFNNKWAAAVAGSRLAERNLMWGFGLVSVAFALFFLETGAYTVQAILQSPPSNTALAPILILLFLGAMTQSAIWPFHRWLLSSLNTPTPVSALMHAGLINGGGFILARFAPLYLDVPEVLSLILIVGLFTAIIGTLWKLMQTDIKRMLACSTMGQMGFMMCQCGMGLFPAAVAHLCWHGLFKAYLFLSSNGAIHEKRTNITTAPTPLIFLAACSAGLLGMLGFIYFSDKSLWVTDTTIILSLIAFMACTQLAIPLLQRSIVRYTPVVLLVTLLTGVLYGLSVYLIEAALAPLNIMQPQPIAGVHMIMIVVLVGSWLAMIFGAHLKRWLECSTFGQKMYVRMLNQSQPEAATMTVSRLSYPKE